MSSRKFAGYPFWNKVGNHDLFITKSSGAGGVSGAIFGLGCPCSKHAAVIIVLFLGRLVVPIHFNTSRFVIVTSYAPAGDRLSHLFPFVVIVHKVNIVLPTFRCVFNVCAVMG